MAVITPTAIVIISTLMLMVLKRIRLWISAIIFTLWAVMRIRQIKDCDEFLLFLRERVNSIHPFLSKNQWGQWVSRNTSQDVSDEKWRTNLDPLSSKLKNTGSVKPGTTKSSSDSSQRPMVWNQSSVEFDQLSWWGVSSIKSRLSLLHSWQD